MTGTGWRRLSRAAGGVGRELAGCRRLQCVRESCAALVSALASAVLALHIHGVLLRILLPAAQAARGDGCQKLQVQIGHVSPLFTPPKPPEISSCCA